MFTDRDGKYQLLSLAESGFDPLARTCRFMLTEEAHHMFVGQTGLGRVIERTCQIMTENPGVDPGTLGVIPLDLVQRYVNRWNSSSLDLFGAEVSSNAASFFGQSLKGRAYEEKDYEDHLALEDYEEVAKVNEKGELVTEQVPLRNAMNEVLRRQYQEDNLKHSRMWNRTIEKYGIDYKIVLPDPRFNRSVGLYAGHRFSPDGQPVDEATFQAKRAEWLPTEEDEAYVKSLMVAVTEPGKCANWIAAPSKGINNQPFEYEYVRL